MSGWWLGRMMTKRNIRAAAFARRLNMRGVVISRSQVYRLSVGQVGEIKLDLLRALCRELACTPNDLIGVDPQDAMPLRVGGRYHKQPAAMLSSSGPATEGLPANERRVAPKKRLRDELGVSPVSRPIKGRFGR
jgi:DNA-binding Xre family transcriptional regulator